VTCQIGPEGNIITDQTTILKNCLNQLAHLSGRNLGPKPKFSDFPTLSPISDEQARQMQRQMSNNKAVTFDGFSDVWFKQTRRLQLITDWWKPQEIK
jgi:hypothetical protein